MARYLAPPAQACGKPEAFIATIIVLAVVAGFLFGYMWTRLNYGALAAQSDIDIQRLLRAEEERSESDVGVGKDPAATSDSSLHSTNSGERSEEDDDPNKVRFGTRALANGRVLPAVIEPASTRPGWARITLTVSSTTASNPLDGEVTFYLHPTFTRREVAVPVENGAASLTLVAYGAFTVGAIADRGATSLGLDLACNPDAPEDFKSR